ncbi:MAG TPA: hypothetical protein VF285_11245, partial [Castellaniella sp.]|uniref:YhdP family protein n=1 Tax=Castellaniella sp. TaxID=1955812 RepID=UPI002EF40951
MRQLNSSHGLLWARRLLAAAVTLYFIFGLALLALRYVVLPQVDHWRPQIEQQLSRSLGTHVTMGALSADWAGWDPGVRVHDLVLQNDHGQILLQVPDVQARLNWKALLPGHRGLLRLEISGMTMTAERLDDGRVSVLGALFAWGREPTELPDWLRWAMTQPVIAFHDVTLRWVDHLQAAPPLVLDRVRAVWTYSPQRGVQLQVSANAPSAAGARLQLRAVAPDLDAFLQERWPEGARAWLDVSSIHPAAWRAWVPAIPAAWRQGELNLQIWMQGADATPVVTVLAGLNSLDWAGDHQANVQIPAAQLWM